MGTRRLNRYERAELDFPVQLLIDAPQGHAQPVERALRRISQGQRYLHLGGVLYLVNIPVACRFVTACPEAQLVGQWPVQLTLRFEPSQEQRVRDILRQLVGDQGYILEDHQPWRLWLRCAWDALLFARAKPPVQLAGGLSHSLAR